jgi:hypothetical protein
MTIIVHAPDGSSIDFPDGTDHATINGVMTQHFPTSAAPSPTPDRYQQAAQEQSDALKAKGVDTTAGYGRQVLQGMTMGGADEALAGLSTPLEMVKHGTFDPREGYNYAKAQENLSLEQARKQHGMLGTAAEVGGSVLSGGAAANAGLTLARPGMGVLGRIGAGATEGAGYGAVSGALDGGDSLSDRATGAGKGALAGALVGGGIPAATGIAGGVLGPIASNIRARINPGGVADSQLARALMESGQQGPAVEQSIQQAAQEGQPGFRVADALGNSGQRMLSTVARAPGAGRQQTVDFLEARQAGQGRRISNALAEGFDSANTAAQTEAALRAARGTAADAEYGAVRGGSNPVNLVDPINHLDRIIGTQPGQVITPANDSIEAALTPFRQRLARVNPDDFEAVQRIRGDMADAAETARRGGQGNRARLIGGAVRQLDTAMENASPGYRQANQNFAQASHNINQVQAGRDASMRGRVEDTIPAFQALTPEGQQAFRAGYVDPLIASTQSAAVGANKARPLTSDAFRDEAMRMAPGNPLMFRQIGRENTMFETRRQATGGSQTADNQADALAQHVDPTIMGALLTGHPGHAAMHFLRSVGNGLNGYTPAVREQMAQRLLGTDVSPAINRVQQSMARRAQIARGLTTGIYAGTGIESQRK